MKRSIQSTRRTALALVAATLASLSAVYAQGAEPSKTADEIMTDVFNRPQPESITSELSMVLTDSRGRERTRRLKQISATYSGVDKKIMEFAEPADVRGTSFMNWSYGDGSRSDDQWIYLPALKRVRRISSDGKGDSFMGSDFSYDDLAERHPQKDSHAIIGTENIDGESCWIIESVSRDSGESYSKTISWISKQRLMGLKREYYDTSGKLLKVLTVKETREVAGYLMITHTEMRNVQKNHRTEMKFGSITADSAIPEDSFTERTLARGL
ncbi:outer membrane lipoprotein-sorting protein [Treponema zuelzerae]|uniref:Outer membrane lipoprotein-sorting protein n=1 Tax=Teretinema zuelzerae TaxID=156 RepID=A0AAE3JK93_9SPIR|nr:outer membrane lipoprotein-sorting protein [Teretinema zuelzerae]MBN2811280.1 outer membrane lipoprotein-sorting protein [Spirochaetales bacterium]MCD1653744.1 outer membrane lipoprotein-sorting protein [Teretinema zuelzerae]